MSGCGTALCYPPDKRSALRKICKTGYVCIAAFA